jgi:hypothetical protein
LFFRTYWFVSNSLILALINLYFSS